MIETTAGTSTDVPLNLRLHRAAPPTVSVPLHFSTRGYVIAASLAAVVVGILRAIPQRRYAAALALVTLGASFAFAGLDRATLEREAALDQRIADTFPASDPVAQP